MLIIFECFAIVLPLKPKLFLFFFKWVGVFFEKDLFFGFRFLHGWPLNHIISLLSNLSFANLTRFKSTISRQLVSHRVKWSLNTCVTVTVTLMLSSIAVLGQYLISLHRQHSSERISFDYRKATCSSDSSRRIYWLRRKEPVSFLLMRGQRMIVCWSLRVGAIEWRVGKLNVFGTVSAFILR